MKKLLTLILGLSLTACGFDARVSDSEHDVNVNVEGETFAYVILRLEFISEIKELCELANPIENFESEALRGQAVAECTINNLNVLNISIANLDDFASSLCPKDADLTNLTEQERADVEAACNVLGGISPQN